jgi:hypothetical protein
MVDNAFKWPVNYSINLHANQKSNDFQLIMSKGIPCHVTKIDKDMVTVAFDTQNGVWTLPTMKMPQAFSPYARDATQVGDHGYASPSDYYLGGNSGLGGGVADYQPRSNLTPLVFHPMSRTKNQSRDYDQYTVTGGKTGVKIWQGPVPSQQQQDQQQQTAGGTSTDTGAAPLSVSTFARRAPNGYARTSHYVRGRGFYIPKVAPRAVNGITPFANGITTSNGTSGSTGTSDGSSSQPSGSFMEIDKNGLIQHVSKSKNYLVTVDEQNSKVTVQAPPQQGNVYLGGDGKDGLYAPVMTAEGPCINVQGRYG